VVNIILNIIINLYSIVMGTNALAMNINAISRIFKGRHQKALLLFLLAGSVVIMNSSCRKEGVPFGGGKGSGGGIFQGDSSTFVGNGKTASQVRTPGNFTAVNVEGVGEVHITQGSTLQLTVSDDSNLLSQVQTTVKDSVLTVGYKPNISVVGGHLVFTIVMPTLTATSITGSGSFDVNGNFVTNGVFKTLITGSGVVKLNGGSADSLSADIEGSGNIQATAYPVKRATVVINGSGEADVAVSDFLNAVIGGTGTIIYTGDPVVKKDVGLTGNVIKR
jgi:hypothetical protein